MDELTMRKHMKERFGKVFNFCENPPMPGSLNIELNNTCNQSCIFCPYHGKYSSYKIPPAVIPYDMVIKILNQAKKYHIGEKEIGFYLAGEAFLYKDLANVIKYAKNLGYEYIFLTTNGALATPENMESVIDSGISSIRFSINAVDREMYKEIHGKDDFDAVVENIKWVSKYIKHNDLKIVTSISCVITKKTLEIKKKIKEMFTSYVDDIIFIPVLLDRLTCEKSFVNEYSVIDNSKLEIDKDFVCPLLFDTMYINANLQILPCCESYNCVLYDLKEDLNLKSAWNSKEYKKYRGIFLYGESDNNTICERCMVRMKGLERFIDN